jgi:hypothetical protein
VPIATVAGSRPELRVSGAARLAPLMVTALGRTGSTIVVHVLERHPEIVAYRPFLYEPRAASYWAGVLRALADPRTRARQLEGPPGGEDSQGSSWWLGTPVPTVDELIAARGAGEQGTRDGAGVDDNAHDGASAVEGAAQRALAAGAGIAELAGFCRGRIDALYEQVARLRDKPEAAFFAEKLVPDWVPDVLWELYPRGREVLLVRDFRDMVASIFAFNRKRGFQGFQRDRLSSDEQYVFEQVADSVAALTRSLERRAERAHVLRYEDLVLEPRRTLAATLGYLGLDASAETVDAMAAGLEQGPSEMEAHMTAASARESIGRWRSDLEPALREACEQALAPALDRFGYS